MTTAFQVACLELLRRDLTRYGMRETTPTDWRLRQKAAFHLMNAMNGWNAAVLARINPFGNRKRELGLDWPAEALTMIGMRRLANVQYCVETVVDEGVPGDLVECGVWRGGAAILMRAALEAYENDDKAVWLADSFEGLPTPDVVNYAMDRRIRLDKFKSILGVSEAQVRENFQHYGLLDDRVKFLPGWFKDTLATSPIERISVLRLDGDLYESTIQALDALYPRLSPGGFCIIDDYGALPVCQQAVTDYRRQQGVTAEIVDIDGSGVYWRRTG